MTTTKKIAAIATLAASVFFAKAAKLATLHEGRRSHVYLDQKGIETVGVGFNMRRPDARSRFTEVGADFEAVLTGRASLTNEQIDALFEHDLQVAIGYGRRACADFDDLPEPVRLVLVDIAFNCGGGALLQFRQMLAAIERRDWEGMITEMLDSKWYRDVPFRVKDDVALLRAGLNLGGRMTDAEREKIGHLVALTTDATLADVLEPHSRDTEPSPPPEFDESA